MGLLGSKPRNFALARAQAYLFAAAGACGFIVLAFPHPPAVNEAAAVPIGIASIVAGCALYAGARRVPAWMPAITPALGTLLATGVIALSESAISAYTLYYLWIGFYCLYFLPVREAIAQIALIAVCFTGLIATVGIPSAPQPHGDVSYFVLAVATLVSAGSLIVYLRGRVERLTGELSGAARTDELTGLPTRRAFRELLEAELERAKPVRQPVSILAGDVDRLQSLNDTLGQDEADRVLVSIAEMLVEVSLPNYTVARIGPGGFGVLMPEVDQETAYMAAEDLLTQIRRSFRASGSAPVTISFGVAAFPRRAPDADQLLRAADRALFTAKVLGRDRAVVSSAEIEELLRGSTRRRTGESLTHLQTLLSIAEALDLREGPSGKHADAVGAFAEELARELGLPEPRVARVRLAGILHDVGKVGVPDSVLYKKGPLDPGEWEQMRRHPEIGARILSSSELGDVREWVHASHEQPDGQGFPRGIAGGEIPIESRIICVADAYEAMVSDRPYRRAISDSQAREELRRGAGTKYDAEVVEAMMIVLDRRRAPVERG